jgi:hypothetical protein
MAMRRESVEDLVRARLAVRFPEETAEVNRQVDLATACAEHLGITMTPEILENLVVEHLCARVASRPATVRTPPAIPLVCRSPRVQTG